MTALLPQHLIIKEDNKVVEVDIDIHTNDYIPDGTVINFLSKDEIVDDLMNRVLSGEDKIEIKEGNIKSLNSLHPSFGSFIRNNYGLWLTPHPYSNARNSAAENFAENISGDIIKQLQTRLA